MSEDFEKNMEFQEARMQKIGKIQEETQFLNTQLEKCIDLVSSSIVNADLKSQFDHMKTENRNSLSVSNDALDYELSGIKNTISEIRERSKEEQNNSKDEDNHS